MEKDNFANKHPYINLIMGLGIVFGFIYLIFKFLLFFSMWMVEFAESVLTKLGKLDVVIIVALITSSVSVVSVLFTSVISKLIDYRNSRREYLAKKREEPYGEFVEMIYKVQQNVKKEDSYTQQEMIEDLSKFSRKITLWGSRRVVKKWVKFRENGANPDAGKDNLLLMEEIMNEMRKDLGLKRVGKGDLLAFFVNDVREVLKK